MALINYLTTVRFDFGALAGLGGELAAVGISRPLIVTDAASRRRLARPRARRPGRAAPGAGL